MNRKFIIALMVITIPFLATAQLRGLMNKIKNKVDQKIDSKVDQQIDKTLDEARGEKNNNGNTLVNPSMGPTQTKTQESPLKSFSQYDFIPGDSILYYENYEQQAIAELPTGWNTTGSGEIVTLDRFEGKWLRLHKQFTYLSSCAK